MGKKANQRSTSEAPTYDLIRERRSEAVELLYLRYGRKLYHYALQSWEMNEDDTWEIVYQTLYKTIEKIDHYTFKGEKEFSSFLFTVFCNLLRRHYRDKRVRDQSLSMTTYSESLFDQAQIDPALVTERRVQEKIVERSVDEFRNEDNVENPLMKKLEDSLQRLEDWERVLLLLRSQNMPYNEIASYLNKPAEQLKVYYHRVRKKLTDMLGVNENENKKDSNGI